MGRRSEPVNTRATGNENFDTYAELDGSNNLVTRRENGTGFDAVIGQQTAAGTVSWDVTDYQGSVHTIIDNSATVLQTSTYSGTGVLTGGSLTTDVGFQGMAWIAPLALYSAGNGIRFDDPTTARFLSEAPKSFVTDPARWVEPNTTGAVERTLTLRKFYDEKVVYYRWYVDSSSGK